MTSHKTKQITIIAIFFTIMVVLQVLTTSLFSLFLLPIRPTLTHIPVIIASLRYGPRVGASLGTLMGMMSLITNSIILSPASHLFSPIVSGGNLWSVVIAFFPRILIGILPYFIYKYIPNLFGLGLASALGSATNTLFVVLGIFLFFPNFYAGDIQKLLAALLTTNSLVEMLLAIIICLTILPRLKNIK